MVGNKKQNRQNRSDLQILRAERVLVDLPQIQLHARMAQQAFMRAWIYHNFRLTVTKLRDLINKQRALRDLRQMDAHMLRDIGLEPGNATAIILGREKRRETYAAAEESTIDNGINHNSEKIPTVQAA